MSQLCDLSIHGRLSSFRWSSMSYTNTSVLCTNISHPCFAPVIPLLHCAQYSYIQPEHITGLNGRHWATYRNLFCWHVNTQVRKELRRPHCMLTYVSEGKITMYTPTTAWLRRVPAHAETPHRRLAVGARACCHCLAACFTWSQTGKCVCLR